MKPKKLCCLKFERKLRLGFFKCYAEVDSDLKIWWCSPYFRRISLIFCRCLLYFREKQWYLTNIITYVTLKITIDLNFFLNIFIPAFKLVNSLYSNFKINGFFFLVSVFELTSDYFRAILPLAPRPDDCDLR